MTRGAQIREAASSAMRPAVVVAVVTGVMVFVRALVDFIFKRKWSWDWRLSVGVGAVLGGFWFIVSFAYEFLKQREVDAVEELFEENSVPDAIEPTVRSGFMAMEYYLGILNRSYVVFANEAGLFGWKFEGVVDCSDPLFYEPYASMLENPHYTRNTKALNALVRSKGSFFIAREKIASVEYSPTSKWGMRNIPHSGKLYVTTVTGKRREFILLGSVDGEAIRELVLHGKPSASASIKT